MRKMPKKVDRKSSQKIYVFFNKSSPEISTNALHFSSIFFYKDVVQY